MKEEDLKFFAKQVAESITHDESSKETKALFTGLKDQFNMLKDIVEEGFKTTHKKQDFTNGKVRKHEEWLNKHGDTVEDIEEERKIIKNKLISKSIDIIFKLAPIGAVIYFIIINK